MAKNGITTQYDDAGYPGQAAFTTSVTLSGSLTGQVIKGSPGRALKLIVTTALAGSGGVLSLYDNASAASGTVLYSLPVATSAINVAGSVVTIDLPAANGIYLANPSGTITSGAVTIGYS
jgi:hypothetical protein